MRPVFPAQTDGIARRRRGGHAAARLVGFLVLTGAALATIGGVVLLPAYAEMVQTEYQLRCLRADVAEAQAWIAVNERLIADLPYDPVITKRLAISQSGWLPDNELVVVPPGSGQTGPAPLVSVPRQPRPPQPSGTALRLAAGIDMPGARRYLFAAAGVAMLAAVLIFGPTRKPGGGGG